MNYEEAKSFALNNKHLVGKFYKEKRIEALVITPKPLNLLSVGESARLYIQDAPQMLTQFQLDFDVVALFFLDDWAKGRMPLDWMLLSDLLKKL